MTDALGHVPRCTDERQSVGSASLQVMGEERYGLPVQPGESHDRAEASTARKIEGDDLVLGDAVEKVPSGPKRKPRGLRNSADPPTEKTRMRCPSTGPYSRTLVTASVAPKGCSLEITILP